MKMVKGESILVATESINNIYLFSKFIISLSDLFPY